LTLLKDPNLHSLDTDIQAQYQFGLQLNASVKKCLALIEKLENKRANLVAQNTSVSLNEEKLLYTIECKLFDAHLTGARMDIFRNPARVLERLLTITKESQAVGADFAPTTQQQKVFLSLKNELDKIKKEVLNLRL